MRALFVFIPATVFVLPGAAGAQERDPRQMLQQYRETMQQLARVAIRAEQTSYVPVGPQRAEPVLAGTIRYTIVHDGGHWRIHEVRRNPKQPSRLAEFETILEGPGTQPVFVRSLVTGGTPQPPGAESAEPSDADRLSEPQDSEVRVSTYSDLREGERQAIRRCGIASIALLGIFSFDNDTPIWEVMLDSPAIDAATEPEVIDGVPTYRVTSRGTLGDHSVWLDPNAGYLPRRVEIRKTRDQLPQRPSRDAPGANGNSRQPPPERVEYVQRIDAIRIEPFDGIPVITAFNLEGHSRLSDGRAGATRVEFRITSVSVKPEEWAPDALELKTAIPEGTPVYALDSPGISYVWKDGAIIKDVTSPVAHVEFSPPGKRRYVWLWVCNAIAVAAIAGFAIRRRRT